VKVKKASYDQEVETARANAELAFKLQVHCKHCKQRGSI
jgi:hypothetical protein